ncbi:unannotated protein [freshwater metagenome]|uniref:Unannotated protein n=1 Tax=freshwater metagenome TaxID=449393 RepID=A0A6J7HAI4_9ZZZZ
MGETWRHGSHHGAQKSTMTGNSQRNTSASKFAVVTDLTNGSAGGSGIGANGFTPVSIANNHSCAEDKDSIAT